MFWFSLYLICRQWKDTLSTFLLNDKKELMHDNQLLKVADFVKKNNIQLIISILKDKLPEELVDKSNIVVELSQNKNYLG